MIDTQMEEVTAVIENYIEGTYKADLDLLKSTFHREARMTGYLGDRLLLGTPEPFFQDIQAHPSMFSNRDPYRAEIKSIVVTGRIASAVVQESGFFGEGRMETHFHLVRNDGWKIISKVFTTV